MTPSLSFREEINDNIRLSPEEKETVLGSTLSPALRLGIGGERFDLHADLARSFSRYSGRKGPDTDDASLRAAFRYRLERGAWGMEGSSVWDSAWRSEAGETGRILAERRRRRRSAIGFFERSLAERTSLLGRYQEVGTQYVREGEGLFDHQVRIYSIDIGHDYSERDRAAVGIQFLEYRAPSARIRSADAALRAEWRHSFSETLAGALSIGSRRTVSRLSFPEREMKERDWGVLADVRIKKKGEASRLEGGFSREVGPSGSGYLIQVDHLSATAEWEITPRESLSVSADGYRTRPLRGRPSVSESRAYRIAPAWRWRWTERWSMEISYRFARQKEEGRGGAASNALICTLSYQGSAWSGGMEGISPATVD